MEIFKYFLLILLIITIIDRLFLKRRINNYLRRLIRSKKVDKTTLTVIGIASFLLDDHDLDVKNPHKEWLNVGKLDYSFESLKEVDDYLEKLKKARKTLSDEEYTKIILRCGAYCGEVMRRHSTRNFSWVSYDDRVKEHSELEDFGKSPETYYILQSGSSSYFPMAKVKKFLQYGRSESLYAFTKAFS